MSTKGIILFGHGARNPEWAAPFHRVRNALQQQAPTLVVELAFLELMQPSLPEAVATLADLGVREIAIVPLFISAGSHIREDLPRLAAEAMASDPGLTITIAAPLGDASAMIDAMASYAVNQISPEPGPAPQLSPDDRLQRVIAATSDGIWEYDLTTHRYSYLSPQAMQMLGDTQSAAMQLDVTAARGVIHPEDLPLVIQGFKQHIQQGVPYDLEMRIRNPQGWLWVRTRGTVVRDAQGAPVRMVGAMIDINELHLANERLLRQQRLIRTVLDVIPEPVLVKDRNLRLVMVNRAYAERAGDQIENLIGRDTREFMPQEEAGRLVRADEAVFETGHDQVFDINVPNRAQHMVRSYVVTKRLAYDGEGRPIMVGIHHDVTELKRSLAQFSAVIEDTPLVAVQGMDQQCRISHWNRASEVMFGIAAHVARGESLPQLILEKRLRGTFAEMVNRVWNDQVVFGPKEVTLRLLGGRKLRLLATVFPVVQDGVVVEVFSMAIDVTARYEADLALARHSEQLQEMVDERTIDLIRTTNDLRAALQSKSEFLANMSHELRTPMHAILSFARLGLERADKVAPERIKEYCDRIVKSGERLLLLINDLLDLSKLEAGKMQLNVVRTDVRDIVVEVSRELAPLLSEKKLEVVLPDDEANFLAEVDRDRVHQVVTNLLSNAIRFSPASGCIRIDLNHVELPAGRRATDAGAQPALCMTVADEGMGIPEGELEQIFDKFVQSSKTRTGAGGTGLGLSICREIVNSHKGRIVARNRPEGGACFEVLLPIKADPVASSQRGGMND